MIFGRGFDSRRLHHWCICSNLIDILYQINPFGLIFYVTRKLPKSKKRMSFSHSLLRQVSLIPRFEYSVTVNVVFALDEALMCQGNFGGRSDEFIVWVYGDDSVSRFNGVVILGNQVSPHNIKERNGLLYTDFNRTVADALANESILDMQGITEAIDYYRN